MYEIKARGSTHGVTLYVCVCVCVGVCVFFACVSRSVSGTLYLAHMSFCQCLVWNTGQEDDPSDSFKHFYGCVLKKKFKKSAGMRRDFYRRWVCAPAVSIVSLY